MLQRSKSPKPAVPGASPTPLPGDAPGETDPDAVPARRPRRPRPVPTATAAPAVDAADLVAEVAPSAPPAAPDEASGTAVTLPAAAPDARTPVAPPAPSLMEKTMSQTTKTTENLFKAAEEAAEFGRGNVEAMTKATQLYVAGVQDLSKQTMALMQGLTEHAMEGAKALAGVKSLKDATEIQTNYTRAALEKTMTETTKLQEASLKLVETSMAPITARMTLAVEKMAKPLAA
jgi:phasin family protein